MKKGNQVQTDKGSHVFLQQYQDSFNQSLSQLWCRFHLWIEVLPVLHVRKEKKSSQAFLLLPSAAPHWSLYLFPFSKEIINLLISGPREAAYPEELYIPCYFQLRKSVQNLVNIIQQLLLCGVVQIRTQRSFRLQQSTNLCLQPFIHLSILF